MADHAHAALHGLLQALGLVQVEHGRAERPQEHAGVAVLHLGRLAGDDVVHLEAVQRDGDGVVDVEARVHEHADLGVGVLAPEAKDVPTDRERAVVAVREHGEGLPDGDGVAIDVEAILVLAAPREGGAVVRVAVALQAGLVAVVDAWDAGQRHLQQGRDPQAADGEVRVVLVQAERVALVVAEGIRLRRVAQDGEKPDPVVAAQQVELARERLRRVVLHEGLGDAADLRSLDAVGEEVQEHLAQRVVHGAVELMAPEVVAEPVVRELVGRVLPDLADHDGVGLLGQGRRLDL